MNRALYSDRKKPFKISMTKFNKLHINFQQFKVTLASIYFRLKPGKKLKFHKVTFRKSVVFMQPLRN